MPTAKASPGTPQTRVHIVGGGCAGLSAAWQLSRMPGYEVHVYERSWRLGGKGASGRDKNGRIHEHGLHVWLGFYENAFRMMRECYAEVENNRWGPHAKDPDERLAHRRFDHLSNTACPQLWERSLPYDDSEAEASARAEAT